MVSPSDSLNNSVALEQRGREQVEFSIVHHQHQSYKNSPQFHLFKKKQLPLTLITLGGQMGIFSRDFFIKINVGIRAFYSPCFTRCFTFFLSLVK